MQTNAAIGAAAVALERAPVATVKVDWANDGSYTGVDDVSTLVESIVIQRQLTTDLPDEVSRVSGNSAAEMTVTLGSDPTTEASNAATYFSPYNTASPLYGVSRRWRTCQAQIGFGTNTLPVFTGKTTSLMVDSATREATLTAIDNAETMRGTVDLPIVTADNKGTFRPGLNSSWVVDYIARKCGYYAAPPLRQNAVFHASFAGSAYPDVGSISAVNGAAGELLTYGTSGKFIQGVSLDTSATGYNLAWKMSSNASTNDGADVYYECWFYPTTFATASMLGAIHNAAVDASPGNGPYVAMYVTTSGTLGMAFRRTTAGVEVGTSGGAPMALNTWHYAAYHWRFTSTGVQAHGRLDGTTIDTTFYTGSSATGAPTLPDFTLTGGTINGVATVNGPLNGYIEAAQVDTYAYGTNQPGTSGTPGWNDAYVGTATIQPSLNTLSVTVPAQASAWEQLQQIAAAELATVGFDEAGRFTFYNRNRWTAAPYTSVQRTISAADSLTAIATSETTDQVRNHIRITATIATVNSAGWVWATPNIISVPASGSTTVTADIGQPVYNLSTSVRYASTSGTTGQSQYRANRKRDGSGTAVSNLTFTVTAAAAQIVTIVITNPNAFIVYLVTSSGFTDPQGTPSLALWGQPVDFTAAQQPDTTSTATTAPSKQIVDLSDATSIAQHGDQLLEISGNPWLQDVTSLTTLATDLLTRLKTPLPILDGLSIAGDPRLQLGDRVTVVEPTLGLNGDFFITGITSTFDSGGFSQALTVRAIS